MVTTTDRLETPILELSEMGTRGTSLTHPSPVRSLYNGTKQLEQLANCPELLGTDGLTMDRMKVRPQRHPNAACFENWD